MTFIFLILQWKSFLVRNSFFTLLLGVLFSFGHIDHTLAGSDELQRVKRFQATSDDKIFTNGWAVQLNGQQSEQGVKRIAEKYGFEKISKVIC